MKTIQRVEPTPLFSEAVIHNGTVWVSGQVAIDHRGAAIEKQIEEVLNRIDRLLEEAGASRETLLAADVILTNADDLEIFNSLWSSWLPDGQAPARTIFIAVLTASDFLVEITARAAVIHENTAT